MRLGVVTHGKPPQTPPAQSARAAVRHDEPRAPGLALHAQRDRAATLEDSSGNTPTVLAVPRHIFVDAPDSMRFIERSLTDEKLARILKFYSVQTWSAGPGVLKALQFRRCSVYPALELGDKSSARSNPPDPRVG